ncbi:MAG: prolipoprotein diacylglyceryl transferase, partial [Solobacterium sp.]|nr:prolipoprotein diacylglyceryl transferase [Solobacterium sp.]
MWNDWLKIGPLTIHGYGVMIAIGILVAFWLAEKQAEKYGLEKDRIDNFIFFVIIFGYACSKLTYCLINFQQFLK